MSAVSAETPTGNPLRVTGCGNPAGRLLLRRFEAALDQMVYALRPPTLLDVGCGEGVLTERWASQLPESHLIGLDLRDSRLRAEWRDRARSNLDFVEGDASRLPFETGQFDTVTAIEVLEHVPDPRLALRELARVGRRALIASVPREPLWRVLNVARGAYLSRWGDSPGHVNHWSRRRFCDFLGAAGTVAAAPGVSPWTLVRVELRD